MAEKKKKPEIRFNGFQNEWEERELGDLVNITSACRVHKNEWTKSGVPFFRSSDVVADYKGLENNKAFISFELYEELSTKSGCVQKNDLLVTGGGSIAIPYLVKTNEPLYFKDGDLLWLKNSDKINGNFLYTFFSTPTFRFYVNSITHIGTISHYTIEQAKSTPIIVPKKEEQDKISEYLTHLDHLITLHQRKFNKLVKVKKAMLEKMFPQKGAVVPEIRFKGFTEEWEEKELGKISDVTKLAGFEFTKYVIYSDEGTIIALRGLNVKNGKIILADVKYIDQSDFSKLNRSKLFEDDILLTYVGTVGELAVIPEDNKYYLAPNVARIRLIKGINSQFIIQMMGNKTFYDKIIFPLIATSSQPALSMENIRKFILKLPRYDEQTKIGNYFKNLDNLITLQHRELEKLKNIKKACLEKMFV